MIILNHSCDLLINDDKKRILATFRPGNPFPAVADCSVILAKNSFGAATFQPHQNLSVEEFPT
jgi:hypothetical protein